MTVKEWKDILSKYDDKKNVVLVSSSGIDWKLNTKLPENPKEKDEQVVIYLK